MEKITWKLHKYAIGDLTDYYKNPRSLTTEQFEQLKKSLDKFGMIDKPIVNLDDAHTVIGGHQRLRVLRADRVKEVECWTPDRLLDDKEVEELNIRLNKNTGGWNFDILANEWIVDDLLEWGFSPNELEVDTFQEKTEPDEIKDQFMILIECDDEQTQADLLNRFDVEGLKCRALIF